MIKDDWRWKYFSVEEMQCKDGCGGLPTAEFMDRLTEIREAVGFPLPVTSGYRCPTYNNHISKSGFDGVHTKGRAADINVWGDRALTLIQIALEKGITGIGVSQKGDLTSRFIHLDDIEKDEFPAIPRPTVWSY